MRRKIPLGRRQALLLGGAALLLALAVAVVSLLGQSRPTPYYDLQVAASDRLVRCMAAVKGYKQELDIPLHPQDWHGTGMLGEEFNGITTTLGTLEAKRTTANGDMAALIVRLFEEAGLKPGDVVGAGFSGSFPAMNLAVVTACDAMGLRLVAISSVGASTHGANNPGLTFPEMLHRLWADGLVSTDSAALSLGGGRDTGEGMDEALRAAIEARLAALGPPLLTLPDFSENLTARRALYERLGPIDCFVAVGGNVSSLGLSEASASLGQGLLPARPGGALWDRPDQTSGLVQRYRADGLPVVNLLNIKKLTADYGLPYDPPALAAPGESAVYYAVAYPRWLIAPALAAACWLCWLGRRRREDASNG